ncbi:MAG: threonine-phosphate decarboxylase CobD [Hyphomonadaceae bacterium]|nr:threonine-phosphate decarboxylase CobD [Hyphomonadaceae bacterium]
MQRNWTHGGALDCMQDAFPDAPSPWIDLSTGINPWPYRSAPSDEGIYDRLPTDAAYGECQAALAESILAPRTSICLAPGSELLIRLLPHHLACTRVAILTPTYGDHAEVWRRAGCDVVETPDPLSLVGEVDAVIICNPNNPDGRLFDCDDLRAARSRLAARGGWLIVDEAFADLQPDLSMAPEGGADGLIVLRSFGKFFGLPGLRLGAMIARDEISARLSEQLGAWPVSSAALETGIGAYRDLDWQARTRQALQQARLLLDQVLISNQIEIEGGTDLFRFVNVDDAQAVWHHLAEAGIYVRRFDALPGKLRIGLPADEIQLARLNETLSLLA